MLENNLRENPVTLRAARDSYAGMVIATADLPAEPAVFSAALTQSLAHWRAAGIKVVWLTVRRDQQALIAPALQRGFVFHHCDTDSLVMTCRLQEDAFVPHPAGHTIGAGAVVISERQELLTVLEKGDATTRPWHFKLPGGMLEPGEHIAAAAVREVFEETGIKTRFAKLLGMRHHHQGQFATSNLYFICRLEPLTTAIRIDAAEIAEARWVPVRDYLLADGVGLLNKRVVKAALEADGMQTVKLDGYMGGPEEYEIFMPDLPGR